MKPWPRTCIRLSALALLSALAAAPAFADRPPWTGGGEGPRADRADDRQERREDRREDRRYERRDDRREVRHDPQHGPNRYGRDYWAERDYRFHDELRMHVHDYYGEQFRRGRCPPGLVKRHDGCMPPGQVRRWEMGQPLPRGVVYAPLPPALLVQLPPPPPQHRYVRVASDVLLIATGTAMVVDAIQDVGR